MDEFIQLLVSHKWVLASAIVIGAVVRSLKQDTRIPITLPIRWRPWFAMALGIVGGVADSIVNGTPWGEALLKGLMAGFLAISSHDLIIKSLRRGAEIRLPLLVKKLPRPFFPPRPSQRETMPPATITDKPEED